jgi:hypothetical protein
MAAALKKATGAVVTLTAALQWPIPGALATVCNGNLEEALLSERTALKPAAMLFKQIASTDKQLS